MSSRRPAPLPSDPTAGQTIGTRRRSMRFLRGATAALAVLAAILPSTPASSVGAAQTAPAVLDAAGVTGSDDLATLASQVAEPIGVAPVRSCGQLARENLALDDDAPAWVGSAQVVAASDSIAEHCRVVGYIEPAIRFEVNLPTSTWNGRYFQTGCGGFCGQVPVHGCADAQRLNFATAAQNMGHDLTGLGWSALWARDPGLREDFAYRSTHVTAVVAKRLIELYYGQRADRSYFGGCSTGGREGQMEASRYPDDFDGIVSGDPAYPQRLGSIFNNWVARHALRPDGSLIFSQAKAAWLHGQVLAACDGADNLTDGLIEDPRNCAFDFARLACASGEDPAGCLTGEELAAVEKLYDFPRNSKGRILYPGRVEPGSEMQLADASWLGGQAAFSAEWLRHAAFQENPPGDFNLRDLDYNRDPAELRELLPLYDPEPDLRDFRRAGGKMLVYHGWADLGVAPLEQIDYLAEVRERIGSRTGDTVRLFLVPGMQHCRGGVYPVDGLDLIEQGLLRVVDWTENGVAPDRLVIGYGAEGTQEGGPVVRTRPAFPYPQVARYDGSGSTDDAANFVPAAPLVDHTGSEDIAWRW
ncbi:tannase/feruloyl esterase family alpha/beta hydrolase [Streptomyces sp. 6N223]|uniref:tannase/feruloyl esterase family alpha/beta hydrolase n=1 Tax=Streptomyces sp. 6N223 TaxID=3457412 RepID=UPI003FD534C4